MKTFLLAQVIIACVCFCAKSQSYVQPGNPALVKRRVRFNFITKDSVNLSLNNEFDLIEDSCSEVVRYAHLRMPQRQFFGAVKDVSKTDPNIILTEGKYSSEGLKEGFFITHYLNGTLQAKGSFKNNNYDGKWEVYYDDGKPKLTFAAEGKDIKIIDAWDTKGLKFVNNGKGSFRVDLGMLYWQGKLLNGKPDGTWRAIKTDDATNTAMVTENFKNGLFIKGAGTGGSYKDSSRIVIVAADYLPFTRAEKMRVSVVPCNGAKRKHIVGVQYREGIAAFSDEIKTAVSSYLSKINLSSFNNDLTLNGEVSTYGAIIKLNPEYTFDNAIIRGLIAQLQRLPRLEPATINGKPVAQKFSITFNFYQGSYRFSYHFLPLNINQ